MNTNPTYVCTTYSIILAFLQQLYELNINSILAMKMGPMGCPETSVRKYHYTLRINPQVRRSHLHRFGSLKSRDVKFTFTKKYWEGKLCTALADFHVRTFSLPACNLQSQRLPNTLLYVIPAIVLWARHLVTHTQQHRFRLYENEVLRPAVKGATGTGKKNNNNVLPISPPIIICSKYDKNKEGMDRACSTNVYDGDDHYDVEGI